MNHLKDELPKELRDQAGWHQYDDLGLHSCLVAAAGEIEDLRAERDRYRNALANIPNPGAYLQREPWAWRKNCCNHVVSDHQRDEHAPDCVWMAAQQAKEQA